MLRAAAVEDGRASAVACRSNQAHASVHTAHLSDTAQAISSRGSAQDAGGAAVAAAAVAAAGRFACGWCARPRFEPGNLGSRVSSASAAAARMHAATPSSGRPLPPKPPPAAVPCRCLVWDFGSRNLKRGVPRAVWYGLEFLRCAPL